MWRKQIDAKAGSALAPSPAMFFEQEPEARATVESDVRALIAEQPRAVLETMIVEYASTKRSVESRIRRAREQLGEAVAEPALRLPAPSPAAGAAGPSTAPLVVAPPPTPAEELATLRRQPGILGAGKVQGVNIGAQRVFKIEPAIGVRVGKILLYDPSDQMFTVGWAASSYKPGTAPQYNAALEHLTLKQLRALRWRAPTKVIAPVAPAGSGGGCTREQWLAALLSSQVADLETRESESAAGEGTFFCWHLTERSLKALEMLALLTQDTMHGDGRTHALIGNDVLEGLTLSSLAAEPGGPPGSGAHPIVEATLKLPYELLSPGGAYARAQAAGEVYGGKASTKVSWRLRSLLYAARLHLLDRHREIGGRKKENRAATFVTIDRRRGADGALALGCNVRHLYLPDAWRLRLVCWICKHKDLTIDIAQRISNFMILSTCTPLPELLPPQMPNAPSELPIAFETPPPRGTPGGPAHGPPVVIELPPRTLHQLAACARTIDQCTLLHFDPKTTAAGVEVTVAFNDTRTFHHVLRPRARLARAHALRRAARLADGRRRRRRPRRRRRQRRRRARRRRRRRRGQRGGRRCRRRGRGRGHDGAPDGADAGRRLGVERALELVARAAALPPVHVPPGAALAEARRDALVLQELERRRRPRRAPHAQGGDRGDRRDEAAAALVKRGRKGRGKGDERRAVRAAPRAMVKLNTRRNFAGKCTGGYTRGCRHAVSTCLPRRPTRRGRRPWRTPAAPRRARAGG